jgi:Cytochrome C oxidase, cbb3-type, subunit III/Cytochrome c
MRPDATRSGIIQTFLFLSKIGRRLAGGSGAQRAVSMMKRIGKWIGLVLLVVVLVVSGGLAYVVFALPRVTPLSDATCDRSPARVARGEYLMNTMCVDCHSARDWTRYSAPVKPGTEFSGAGEQWNNENAELPGNLWAPNLTPTHLGDWSDAEIIRAFTEGVSRDGRPLFPMMPYGVFRLLPREDVESIVAYLRSMPAKPMPAHAANYVRRIDFPMSLIVHLIPEKAAPQTVDTTNKIAYGEFLTKTHGCRECHSPQDDNHNEIPDRIFSGGVPFVVPAAPGAHVRSANITPDPVAGIGNWNEETFIERFKLYEQPSADTVAVKNPKHNTLMPWTVFARLTRDDLSAIYGYLRTVKPASGTIQKFDE